ncbi:MAG TPA: type II toxin-antitoxin system prevent-host-death family antitoxin [Candidatus Polarisedimenticolaceae bacterium]|nr:type II toxin-antitoxin system prevent-host-death family antitoxin [Candidatus Polarisedimenticolaceae bacterium]
MTMVNVHEAKTRLSKLLEQVEDGEEIIIARNGHPVARLVPMPSKRRRPGRLRGKIVLRRDFDAALPASLKSAFSGKRG